MLHFADRNSAMLQMNAMNTWSRPWHHVRKYKIVLNTLVQQIFEWHSLRICSYVFSLWRSTLGDESIQVL